jgi:hypothetical protein
VHQLQIAVANEIVIYPVLSASKIIVNVGTEPLNRFLAEIERYFEFIRMPCRNDRATVRSE